MANSHMRGKEALERFLAYELRYVLDIGSGKGIHASMMRDHGVKVTTIDSSQEADIQCEYMLRPFYNQFDGIWACHVLEHTINPGAMLKKMLVEAKPGGVIAVTVPWGRDDLVDGHVTTWYEGFLLYQMVVAGYDCSEARVGVCYEGKYIKECSVITKAIQRPRMPIKYDKGDLELLRPYFPCNVYHGITAKFGNVNWDM